MTIKNIPSDEEFARASAKAQEDNKGLDIVRNLVLNQFQDKGVHEAFILFSPSKKIFKVYIFYQNSIQIKEAENSGINLCIKRTICNSLKMIGRIDFNINNIEFVFDSHENVKDNYEGDYFLYLR